MTEPQKSELQSAPQFELQALTFIGFGEAAKAMIGGLREAHPDLPIHLYDIRFGGAEGDALRAQAAALGAVAHDSLAGAVAAGDIVLSTVVARAAVAVAEAAAAHLRPGQLYVDLNSAAPGTKQRVAAVLAPSGCGVIDGAILSPVPRHRHRVPILLCGPRVAEAVAQLAALGFNVEDGGATLGAASATKMLRSIMIKGVEALFLECVAAASHFGATERVLNSLQPSLPGLDWPERARYLTSRTALHGARRAVEMTEAAAMLRDIGMDPLMAEAAARRIAWGAEQGLAEGLVDGGFPTVEAMERAFAGKGGGAA
jgi:3-hydroxyisobutyrate dehydrogenase-like beta-hydroxyacid dehydrogenase